MAKRRVAKIKYFHGDVELINVGNILALTVADPLARGPLDGPRILAGQRPRETGRPVTHDDLRWLPVERTVRYLARPDPHQCDWRCLGAMPNGDCECECMGRNHGRKFRCEAA